MDELRQHNYQVYVRRHAPRSGARALPPALPPGAGADRGAPAASGRRHRRRGGGVVPVRGDAGAGGLVSVAFPEGYGGCTMKTLLWFALLAVGLLLLALLPTGSAGQAGVLP